MVKDVTEEWGHKNASLLERLKGKTLKLKKFFSRKEF